MMKFKVPDCDVGLQKVDIMLASDSCSDTVDWVFDCFAMESTESI
jgi:hypothetical protein